MVTSPTGLRPENDCADECQQQLKAAEPSSCQRARPTSPHPQLSDSNKNLVESTQLGALFQDILVDCPSVVT
jgi:hypothetical protein